MIVALFLGETLSTSNSYANGQTKDIQRRFESERKRKRHNMPTESIKRETSFFFSLSPTVRRIIQLLL